MVRLPSPLLSHTIKFFRNPTNSNCGDPNLFNQFETFLRAATFLNLSSFQKHLFSIIRTVSKLSKTDRSNRQIGTEAFTRWGGRDRNPTEVFRQRLPLYPVTVGCLRQIRSGWQKTAKGENIRNGTVPTKCFPGKGPNLTADRTCDAEFNGWLNFWKGTRHATN